MQYQAHPRTPAARSAERQGSPRPRVRYALAMPTTEEHLDSAVTSPSGWTGKLKGSGLIVAIVVVAAALVAISWMSMTYERGYALGFISGCLVFMLGTLCNALARR